MAVRVGLLTVKDSVYWGDADDECIPIVADWLGRCVTDADVELEAVVQQLFSAVAGTLVFWADEVHLDLIVTLGGATPGYDRVAIEAAHAVAEPLLDVHAALAGTRRSALIVNLPGDVEGVQSTLEAISPFLRERWNERASSNV